MSSDKSYLIAIVILVFASTIINLGFSALSPVFPYLILALKGVLSELPDLVSGVIEAHKGAMEFGALMAAFMVTRAPTAGVIGFLSDVLGKKRTILFGMGLYVIVSIGFLLSNSIILFIVFRGVQGIASAMVWPVAEAYLADISPRWSRGKAISLYTSSMLIAEILGPGIGVAIYKLYITWFDAGDVIAALKSPIIFLVISSLASLVTLLFIPEYKIGRLVEAGGVVSGIREVLSTMKEVPSYIARSLRVIYLNGLINGVAMGVTHTVVIVYIIEVIVKDPVYIGLFYTLMSIVALPASLLAGYLSDRVKKRKPFVIAGYLIGRSVLILMPFIRNLIAMLFLGSLLSLVFGLAAPIMRTLQADLAPEGTRGSIFGIQQFFFNGGAFLGSLLGGYLTNKYATQTFQIFGYILSGYIVPFWFAGLLGIITTILFIIYVEERK